MRLSSSSPFFRGVSGPAPLLAWPCGWTKRGGCCMTTKPCKRFLDNEDQKLTVIQEEKSRLQK